MAAKEHFIASLLLGDESALRAVERALRGRDGRDLTVRDVVERARRLAEHAREQDPDRELSMFKDGSNADELVEMTMTEKILDRIDSDGVSGRSVDMTNVDRYDEQDVDGDS